MKNIKKYKQFESINVQDIMTFPTFISKTEKRRELLEPFYDEIEKIPGVKNISDIMQEKIDGRIGFSFVIMYEKILILADEKQAHILINNQLIPLNKKDNLFKIIQGEL